MSAPIFIFFFDRCRPKICKALCRQLLDCGSSSLLFVSSTGSLVDHPSNVITTYFFGLCTISRLLAVSQHRRHLHIGMLARFAVVHSRNCAIAASAAPRSACASHSPIYTSIFFFSQRNDRSRACSSHRGRLVSRSLSRLYATHKRRPRNEDESNGAGARSGDTRKGAAAAVFNLPACL